MAAPACEDPPDGRDGMGAAAETDAAACGAAQCRSSFRWRTKLAGPMSGVETQYVVVNPDGQLCQFWQESYVSLLWHLGNFTWLMLSSHGWPAAMIDDACGKGRSGEVAAMCRAGVAKACQPDSLPVPLQPQADHQHQPLQPPLLSSEAPGGGGGARLIPGDVSPICGSQSSGPLRPAPLADLVKGGMTTAGCARGAKFGFHNLEYCNEDLMSEEPLWDQGDESVSWQQARPRSGTARVQPSVDEDAILDEYLAAARAEAGGVGSDPLTVDAQADRQGEDGARPDLHGFRGACVSDPLPLPVDARADLRGVDGANASEPLPVDAQADLQVGDGAYTSVPLPVEARSDLHGSQGACVSGPFPVDARADLHDEDGACVSDTLPVDARADLRVVAWRGEGAPKKPTGGGYGVYLAVHRAQIIKSLPAGSNPHTDAAEAAGARWTALTEAQRKPYVDEFAARLVEYSAAMKAYNAWVSDPFLVDAQADLHGEDGARVSDPLPVDARADLRGVAGARVSDPLPVDARADLRGENGAPVSDPLPVDARADLRADANVVTCDLCGGALELQAHRAPSTWACGLCDSSYDAILPRWVCPRVDSCGALCPDCYDMTAQDQAWRRGELDQPPDCSGLQKNGISDDLYSAVDHNVGDDLQVGDDVEVHSLLGAWELNGRLGRLVSWVEATQRFGVRLEGEMDDKAVKPKNLRRAPRPPRASSSSDGR
eukprot:TRINITY_DN7932_c0_g1_i2.p1 TRINITY_DN7932_c0_g1~~TRINITY_DN7932_c0_g1_i2.p1  ORF type:complete len:716 (-),score=110.58 TRINITY_DN7932_c0_g1_i2:162-2309(-)